MLSHILLALLSLSLSPLPATEGGSLSTIVPAKGVYLVTLEVDPYDWAELRLKVNGRDVDVVASAKNRVYAGVSVAIPLRENDKVEAHVSGKLHHRGQTSLGVAYVSPENIHFTTYKSNGADSHTSWRVPFNHYMNYQAKWSYLTPETYIYVVKTGMHWVMARPDCANEKVTVDIGPGLFKVVCDHDRPILTSGAFLLTLGTLVRMMLQSGRYLQSWTTLSVVYLVYNNRPNLTRYDHVAFTGWVGFSATYQRLDNVAFEGSLSTNHGDMYQKNTRSFRIPVTGHYVIGVRMEPVGQKNFRVRLYHNKVWVFSESGRPDPGPSRPSPHKEEGVESGVDGVYVLNEGDRLEVKAEDDGTVGTRSMISIALLKRHDGRVINMFNLVA